MSNYTQTTFFTPKDSLPAGNAAKTIFGAQFDTEFGNISTAISSKPDASTTASFLNVTVTGTTAPNTGIYQPSGGVLGLMANAVQAMTLSGTAITSTLPATLASLNVTSATLPANGIYLSAANTLSFATNTTARGSINATGAWSVFAPTSGTALTLNAAGASLGLSVVGANSQYAQLITGGSGAGTSFGLLLRAGTNASDTALSVANQSGATTWFQISGAGVTSVADDGGTLQIVGFRGTPLNTQTTSYTLQLSDRGKTIYANMTTGTITVPYNVFSPGDVVTICLFDSSAGSVSIAAQTNMTIFWANGSGYTFGNRTLTDIGIATLLFIAAGQCVISGSGLS